MNKKRFFIIFFVVFGAMALLFPHKMICGAPLATCAQPPLPGTDKATYYYEVQPFGITVLENITNSNIRVFYYSGEE